MESVQKEELIFLEWLRNECNKEGKIPKIDAMPLSVFSAYAKQYCCCTSKGKNVEKELIRSFKGNNFQRFFQSFRNFDSIIDEKERRNFRYVLNRYLLGGSPYKCLILPLKADYEVFKDLVTEYWSDLDGLSANYLDIYYIFEDYCYSGFSLMREFESLDMKFHTSIPCIIIWKDSIDNAKAVSIDSLSTRDVYGLINEIVLLIQSDGTFNKVVEGANNRGNDLRIQKNSLQYIQGGTQIINKGNNNVVVIGSDNHIDVSAFSHDVEKAIQIVDSDHDLTASQKCELKDILLEAKEGVQENSQEKKALSKSRFKTFLAIAGRGALALINAFASLSTIASFFELH